MRIQRNRLNTLRPRRNGRHFPDDIFKWIFLNENVWISIEVSLKFVRKGPNNNIPALVQIMTWRWPGDKPLSEPMMVNLPTHICVTRPQWVKFCLHSLSNFVQGLWFWIVTVYWRLNDTSHIQKIASIGACPHTDWLRWSVQCLTIIHTNQELMHEILERHYHSAILLID